ncbi:MAG TPA: ribosome small subunit-dependent GTPase A [Burkholderiaceae bacterium]|nr:ribosome small subunit-dependent GTPase A [Burkholderiaceae bacterium]
MEIDFDRLRPIGLTPGVAQAILQLQCTEGRAVRVTQVQRETVLAHDGIDEFAARVAPDVLRSPATVDALAVGDWGVVRNDAQGAAWLVRCAMAQTRLVRRAPDGTRQALVHNVDTAFLLMGLDGDFNPRRIERYLALVQPAGIWPVIVLTKLDCVADATARVEGLRARIPADVPVVAVDATAGAAAQRLAPYLDTGRTVVLLGSSGTGKSTLSNTLAGTTLQETGAVRADDSRGRHTTTARSLRVIAGSACVIDTPGLRGLRPDIDPEELGASFSDIDALGQRCRFRDCAHRSEPGCAVRAAIDADRLANFHKLQREIRRDRMDPLARQQWQQQMKVRARALRARLREKQ